MPGGFYKNCKIIALILICHLFIISCVTTSDPVQREDEYIRIGQDDTSSVIYRIKDIQPAGLVYEAISLKSLKFSFNETYLEKFNNSVDYINNEEYQNAIDVLLTLCFEYNDKGKSFYNLGYCYYKLGDLHTALKYAAYAQYAGFKQADKFINDILFQIGYDFLMKKEYKEAIRYFKNCYGIKEAYQNVLFAYLELVQTLTFPENTIMLLYAGDYCIRNTIRNENIIVLGNELSIILGENPEDEFLHHAIEIIQYGLTVKDDPFLHKSLAFLYLYNHEDQLAYQEFKKIVKNKKADKDLVKFASEKLIELEKVKYLYKRELPFTVQLLSGSLQDRKLEFIFTLPLNNTSQTVTDVKVFLNNTQVEYEIVKDSAKIQFIKIHVGELVRKGKNKIKIQAIVEREAKRFSTQEFSGLMISDFDTSDPLYELYTKPTTIIPVSHPEIVKMKKELVNVIKSDHVIEIVKAVYEYVINKMRYEMYENENRPKNRIITRLKETGYSGVCEDYSVLTVSLLRSFGIPSLNLSGPCFNSDIGHSWPAFFTPGYEIPVVIDTTWGDTSEMPGYYFLFNSNLTVIENFGWDSDIISDGYSSSYISSSTIKITLNKESTVLEKL